MKRRNFIVTLLSLPFVTPLTSQAKARDPRIVLKDKWHHCNLVRSGLSVKAYIDGKEVSTTRVKDNLGPMCDLWVKTEMRSR